MSLLRRAAAPPPPRSPVPTFPDDQTLGQPDVAAAVACALVGDFAGVARLHRGATDLGSAHAMLNAVANRVGLDHLWQWRAARAGDPVAATLFGLALIADGWRIRGGGRGNTVANSAMIGFHERLRTAEVELAVGTTHPDSAASAWTGLVIAGRGLEVPQQEKHRRYQAGLACGGNGLLELQEQALQGVCDKWGGSHEAMFRLARSHASPGEPLASNALVCIAHLEGWIAERHATGAASAYLTQPDVVSEVRLLAATAWSPGFPAGFDGLAAHNVFAVTLAQAGDLQQAARHVRYLGPRVREWPWVYLARPGDRLAELRQRG